MVIVQFGQALAKSRGLRTIDLSGNAFDKRAAETLAKSLEVWNSFRFNARVLTSTNNT